MHKTDVLSICSLIVGIGALAVDGSFKAEVSSIFGTNGPVVLGGIGLVSTVASQVLRVLSVPADTTQQATAAAVAAVKGPTS